MVVVVVGGQAPVPARAVRCKGHWQGLSGDSDRRRLCPFNYYYRSIKLRDLIRSLYNIYSAAPVALRAGADRYGDLLITTRK